jgi:hypothetical protein
VQSAHGNLLVIPREGGYLVRLYVEMDKLGEEERVANRGITLDQLIAAAQRILHPYTLEVKEVPGGRSTRSASASATSTTTCRRDGGVAAAARLHRRRRLPHPQPEGGAGHELLHAGHLQPGLEAGAVLRGSAPRSCCTPIRPSARWWRRS